MERTDLAQLLGGEHGGVRAHRAIIAEADPARFMATFAAAVAGGSEVFLADPAWREVEHGQMAGQLSANPPQAGAYSPRSWLMIPTGGSSGRIKFARHDQDTIAAAVAGFTRHFGLTRVNAVGLLPLHHVSGLMAWMRCVLTGGEYRPASWKDVEEGRWPDLPDRKDGWVISLVPTQLERLLRDDGAVKRLRGFRCIFLGGAPAWADLLERAAAARLPLSIGYGMTETAAMATALKPEEFLAGRRDSGTALPHVRLGIDADGRIMLAGESIFRGYYPEWRADRAFTTEDLGKMDAGGHLTVLGRRDGLIISGGEKVQPEEVEAVLRTTKQFTDVAVLGLSDPEWGQRVVAAYPAADSPDWLEVDARVSALLAPAKRPKQYVALAEWPRNAQGKLNRALLPAAVEERVRAGAGRQPD